MFHDDETPNASPTASFGHTCNRRICDFSASSSVDADGTIARYDWSFDDGTVDVGQRVAHEFPKLDYGRTYRVTLRVTDDDGASDSTYEFVGIAAEQSQITLEATAVKDRGRQRVDLVWGGASTDTVDVYRNGAVVTNTPNDGSHSDPVSKGPGSYTYRLCEANASTCSDEVVVTF